MKLVVLILSVLVFLSGIRITYSAYYGSSMEVLRPLKIPLKDEARSGLLNLDKEVLVDLIYDRAKSDIKGMENYNKLMDSHASVYKTLMWLLVAQLILTVLAALNKPLLWTRKKPLAKE